MPVASATLTSPDMVGGSSTQAFSIGIASFTGLKFNQLGPEQLTLTSSIGTSVPVPNSSSFTVVPVSFYDCTAYPSAPHGYTGMPFVTALAGRTLTVTDVAITGAGTAITQPNTRRVPPGAALTITANYSGTTDPPPYYCPGCVVSFYTGLPGLNNFLDNGVCGNRSMVSYVSGSVGGTYTRNFNAPTIPGLYYISIVNGLNYACPVGDISFGNDASGAFAYIVVESCNTSDIIQDPSFTYPVNIDYTTAQAPMSYSNSIAVWRLKVRDAGVLIGDSDNKPTVLQSLQLTINNINNVLDEVALFRGTTLLQSIAVPNGTSVQNFNAPAIAANVVAPDDDPNGVDIDVRVTFKSTVVDNTQVSFSIAAGAATAAPAASSSQFAAFPMVGPSSTAGDNNRLAVTATQLQFSVQPPASVQAAVLTPVTIRAVDALGNVDANYTGTISLSNSNIHSGSSVAAAAGVAVFSTLSFSGASIPLTGQVLNATSVPVLTGASSIAFTINPSVFHFKFASGSANTLANWELAGSPLIQPVGLGIAGATYIVGAGPAPAAVAQVTAPIMIANQSAFQVSNTSTLVVNDGQSILNNGVLAVNGGGKLTLQGSGNIAPASANPVTYASTTATLHYTDPSTTGRTANVREIPVIFNGSLTISRTGTGASSFNFGGSKTILGAFLMDGSGTANANAGETLTLNGATMLLAGELRMNSTAELTVPTGGTFSVIGGTLSLNGTGVATVNGTFVSSGGAVNIGSSSLVLGGPIVFGAGSVVPAAGLGQMSIVGSGAITGTYSGGVQFQHFTLNRSGAVFEMTSGTNLLTQNLTLSNGILRTGGAANYVEVAGTLTATGSATTYVDGKLRRVLLPAMLSGSGTFDFPVGKGSTYLPFRLFNVTGNSVVVQVEAFNTSSGAMPGPLFILPSTTEYWQTTLISGTLTNAFVGAGRLIPTVLPSSVVGRGTALSTSFTGLGGSVSGAMVLSGSPVAGGNHYFALGLLPNVFYYKSGGLPPHLATSWNSEIDGTGADATDFATGGTSFIVAGGRNAVFSSSATFAPGVLLMANGNDTISVRSGAVLTANGVNRIADGGALILTDSARIVAPSGVFYLGEHAKLVYQQPNNRIATVNEFPCAMPGSLEIIHGALRLDTNAAAQHIQIQGGLKLHNATLDFGKDSTHLSISGAIAFNSSFFRTNPTHRLTLTGSGVITGTVNFEHKRIGWLTMQRPSATLPLSDSLCIHSRLDLLSGNIAVPHGKLLLLDNPADSALQGGYASSFVHGKFARKLSANVSPADARYHFYPVGKGTTYLPLTLFDATTGTVAPVVAVEAFNVGSGGSVGLGVRGALSGTEYWQVEPFSGAFIGARVGVIRPSPLFAAAHTLVWSTSRTGAYYALPSNLLTIPQGTSLVGASARITEPRFFSSVAPSAAAPVITGFAPSIGGAHTQLIVRGENLTGVNAVAIGGIHVGQFHILSSTTILVTVGAVNTGPIQIGSPNGGAASDSVFTFVPAPVITNAEPSSAAFGDSITINGAYFHGASVMIGGVTILANRFTVSMDGTSIKTTVPINAANAIVTIATLGGMAVSTNALILIPPPNITFFTPASATTGQTITVFGQHFERVRAVLVGSSNAQYTVNAPNRMTVIIPPRSTTDAVRVPITVRTQSGTGVSALLFSYADSMSLGGGIEPLRQVSIRNIRDPIVALGGQVRVTGANLELIRAISLRTSVGETTATWTLFSASDMVLFVPTTGLLSGTHGTVSSAATTLDVLGAFNRVVLENAFHVVSVPRIASIVPLNVEPGGEITLTGTNLH
ncbi:MAG: hypothetical protein RML40_11450, partial [Bacteroidota bacterium]|nr:hypothetical protein [Bacteroidota bacterium]